MSAFADGESKTDNQTGNHLCVVFLAHMGVQQKEIWKSWRELAQREVSFVVCREKNEEVAPKTPSLFLDDNFKIKIKEETNQIEYNKFIKQTKISQYQDIMMRNMRIQKSLQLKNYKVVPLDTADKDNVFSEYYVPHDDLVVSEWSSPEIALNTTAALKFAVNKTNADAYWIVSGFDIPLVHPDSIEPFIHWSEDNNNLLYINKQRYLNAIKILQDDRFLNKPTIFEFNRKKREITKKKIKYGETYDDLYKILQISYDEANSLIALGLAQLNELQTDDAKQNQQQQINENQDIRHALEILNELNTDVLLHCEDADFQIALELAKLENTELNALKEKINDFDVSTFDYRVRGSQWMCLNKEDASFIGDTRHDLMVLFAAQFYKETYTMKTKKNFRYTVADETFIHTILSLKYHSGTNNDKPRTTYIPNWIPEDSNTLKKESDTWLVGYFYNTRAWNPVAKHICLPESEHEHPLKTILQYEYYNIYNDSVINKKKIKAIVSYRKIDQSFPINESDMVFLNNLWVHGFSIDECKKTYIRLQDEPRISKPDERFDHGNRFVKLRF